MSGRGNVHSDGSDYAHEHMHPNGSAPTHGDQNPDGSVHTHDHPHPDGSAHEHDHPHTHPHGHGHTHPHGHGHTHTHDPKQIRKIINRVSRSIGHMESVKRMLEDGRDCSEVLVQLAAVRAEINNAGKELLKEHIAHCIVDAIATQDEEAIRQLNHAIDQFMK